MALKQRDDSKKYLRVKDGKIYIGKDLETPYDEIEGTVNKLQFKDEEYEGKPQRKLIMVMSDSEGSYQLNFNVESSTYSSLVGFLANVDLSKPITLHPRMEVVNRDGTDYSKRSMLVSQEGKFAKSYFTKDEAHGLPRWDVVVVGKKKVVDKEAYLDFLEQFVTKKLASQLTEAPEITKPAAVAAGDDEQEHEEFKAPWDN